MNTKNVLPIREVFDLMTQRRVGTHDVLVLRSGQTVPMTKNLWRLNRLVNRGHALECCECGCIGTVLQRRTQPLPSDTGGRVKVDGTIYHVVDGVKTREIWNVMSYSNRHDRVVIMTIDHIVAKSRGGMLDVNNTRIMCDACNGARGDKRIVDERQYLMRKYGNVDGVNAKIVLGAVRRRLMGLVNWKGRFVKFKNEFYRRLAKLRQNVRAIAVDVLEKTLAECLRLVNVAYDDSIKTVIFREQHA